MADITKRDNLMELIDDEEDEDTQANKFLIFDLGEESFGIEIRYITEIISFQKITELPDMPDFIKGVINLRGKVIPIIDVRVRFRLDKAEHTDRTSIVIVQVGEKDIGLIVDTVAEILEILEVNIDPPPHFKSANEKSRYIKGLGKVKGDVKILLDIEKLLYEEEMKELESI
jgi:purine-binding chemotaxis protein CheW